MMEALSVVQNQNGAGPLEATLSMTKELES